MKKILFLCFLVCCAICLTLAQQSPAGKAGEPYRDPSLPIEQRVNDLVSRMTLEEKVSQLGHTADAVPRLGIPEYNWWSEGLHGVARAGTATVFPQAIGMAATFDEPLLHRIGDVVSTEFRAKYYETLRKGDSSDQYRGLTVWSPNINIFRDPRWGRGQETYGEDPYLTSRLGIAYITGLQGNDPKYFKTVATSKHFAVHSGPETTRHTVDVRASRHDMEDTYLPAFRATITEGKVDSVMCAYNSLNGQPACANTALLQEHLRQDWGFQGYVVSDCGAVTDIFEGHKFTQSIEQGVSAALKAGTDLICGSQEQRVRYERGAILKAVHQGLLSEADVDGAVRRIFTARFRLGMFDPRSMVPYSKIPASENDSEAHRQLALTAARESIVLLKNAPFKGQENLLPLKHAYKTIAVIGPDADSLDALVGNYNGTPSKPVTVLAGIRRRFAQSEVLYAKGTNLITKENDDEALSAARKADLVVMVLGLSPTIEGEEMNVKAEGFSGGDRTGIDLPAPQQLLLEHVARLGKPTILLLMNGSALGVNWADKNLPAIVEAWYPGGEGGTAVAEALAGDFSPAGRLPVTFYKSIDQLPPFDDYSMAKRTYRYFSDEPLYPFGYGLSYTSFTYSHARVDNASVPADGKVVVSVDVNNDGAMAGDEVVELYLTHAGIAGAPLRALKGFQRVHLEPGKQQAVSFELHDRGLSIVDEAGKHRVLPGAVQVWIGGGQPLVPSSLAKPAGVSTQFTISGEATLPD
jgi:beta-glucosidase